MKLSKPAAHKKHIITTESTENTEISLIYYIVISAISVSFVVNSTFYYSINFISLNSGLAISLIFVKWLDMYQYLA